MWKIIMIVVLCLAVSVTYAVAQPLPPGKQQPIEIKPPVAEPQKPQSPCPESPKAAKPKGAKRPSVKGTTLQQKEEPFPGIQQEEPFPGRPAYKP